VAHASVLYLLAVDVEAVAVVVVEGMLAVKVVLFGALLLLAGYSSASKLKMLRGVFVSALSLSSNSVGESGLVQLTLTLTQPACVFV
jgi:hypothetical protein